NRVPRERRSRRVDGANPLKNSDAAGRPQPLSPSETWREPRGASLVWLGHSLAKAIRRVQIPRTALSIEPKAVPFDSYASARRSGPIHGSTLVHALFSTSEANLRRRHPIARVQAARTRRRNCGPML